MEILLSTMQAHPGIARGMYNSSKEDLNRVWRNLEAELNSAGPPTKNIAEWKKVWCDQKRYVRQKAAQNHKMANGTGGGPNQEYRFSAIEEEIYNLTAMKESVEGVANRSGLGTSSSQNGGKENDPPELADIVNFESLGEVDQEEVRQEPPPKKSKTATKNPPPSTYHTDILSQGLSLQEKMLKIMEEQQQSHKRIYRAIERLHDLKKEEIKEQKRHNMAMEQLRIREVEDKIEKNRRLLELEELKYQN
ncbi:uncharacterized protein [Musca autumnalis]|uniref:uncharacterized protein n=1 Tax=Musca autumnalis TaxID=221902 RepID=UPI003CF3875D